MKSVEDILIDLVNIRTDDVNKSNKPFVDYVCDLLTQSNVRYKRVPARDGIKESIVAIVGSHELRDLNSGIVLSGHMDTVPSNENEWDTDPYQAVNLNGRIYGRGTVDMKYFMACIIALLPELKDISIPVLLAFSCDEETDVLGVQDICHFLEVRNIRPKYALVGEATDFKLCTGSKGYYGYTTTVKGKSAHSGYPEHGINAAYIGAKIISKVEELNKKYAPDNTTLNVGIVKGGEQRNAIPSDTIIDWEIRTYNSEYVTEILTEMEKLNADLMKEYPGSHIERADKELLPAFKQREKGQLYKVSESILKTEETMFSYATEAGFFQKAGIETLICGVSGEATAHTSSEYVLISDLTKYTDFLRGLIFGLDKKQ